MLKITATFIDEITGDIPHQNWLADDWDKDFAAMKAVGIDSVTMIRCGHGRWITHPSKVLEKEVNAYTPVKDLTKLFLDLAEKHGMKFHFANYNGGDQHGCCDMQCAEFNGSMAELLKFYF